MVESTSSGNPPAPHSSILSEKVSRALQLRTDTPVMKAALDALANLQRSGSDGNKQEDFSFDSRSVRVAIEQDALQQALKLQEQLHTLVRTVQDLRHGVSETAEIARRVKAASQMQVVTAETHNSMIVPGSSSHREEDPVVAELLPSSVPVSSASAAHTASSEMEEVTLASQLSDAFLHRDVAQKRLAAVHAFMERFDLSQQDSRLLDHYNFEDVAEHKGMDNIVNGIAFLKALERVRHIRVALTDTFGREADDAMGEFAHLQTQKQGVSSSRESLGASSALRMMENLAQKQERAYERLYHWLQQYLHLFSDTNSGNNSSSVDQDILDEALQHSFVKRALYTLRHVPAFYSHTLELIASSRRAEETRRFLLALTSGYAGMSPIEMKAHDPVAYVSDMLAFSFKAISVEGDLAKGLLEYHPEEDPVEDYSDRVDDETSVKKDGTSLGSADMMNMSSLEKSISSKDILAISMSGLARPLKSRVLQVVATLSRRPDEDDDEADDEMLLRDDFEEEGAMVRTRVVHLYEICGLLLFYKSAMEKGIQKLENMSSVNEREGDADKQEDDTNPLILSLIDCLQETTNAYEATVRAYGAMVATESSQVQTAVSLVADVRTNSPGFSQDVNCPTDECRTILSMEWATETLIEAALVRCASLDDVLALRESVRLAERAGLTLAAVEKLDGMVGQRESSLIGALIEAETKKVLDLCGLANVAEAWRQWQLQQQVLAGGETEGGERTIMSGFPGLSQDQVEEGIKDFYASLYSPPLPSLETQVKDPLLRKKARSKIAHNVGVLYSDVYASISNSGGYEDISFLVHSPDQVNTLFSA